MATINGKVCPDDFNKAQLVRLTSKKVGLPTKKIQRLNKDSLCKTYSTGEVTIVPSSRTLKRKAPAKPKKISTKKAPPKKKVPIKKAPPAKKQIPVKKPQTKKPPIKKPGVSLSPYPDKEGPPKSPPPKTHPPKILAKKPCIEQSSLPLKEHQIRVVNHIRNHRGLIVSHVVGSGKTLTAVTATQCYLEDNPNGEVLIVTPVSLQDNFKKEMRAYGVDPDKSPWKNKYKFFTLQGFATTYNNRACSSLAML